MSSVRTPNVESIIRSHTPTFLVHPPIFRNTEAGCIASLNLGFSNFPQNPAEQEKQIKLLADYIVQLNKEGVVAFMFQEAPAPDTEHFLLLTEAIERLNPGMLNSEAMKQSYKKTGESSTGTSCLLQTDKIGFDSEAQEHARTGETMYFDVYTLYLLDGTNRKFNIVNVNGDVESQEETIEIITKGLVSNYMICGDWNVTARNNMIPTYFESCGVSTATKEQNLLYGFYDAASMLLKRQAKYKEDDVFHCFQLKESLDKETFITALKYYWGSNLLNQHQEKCHSPVADAIAEQAWVQYQVVCDMFAERKYFVGKVKDLHVFRIKSVAHLNIHSWIFDVNITFSLEELKEMNHISFPAHLLQPIFDLPRYTWTRETEHEEAFVGGNSQLMTHVSNSDSSKAGMFINMNADVNQYSAKDGNTALLLAVSKGWNHVNREHEEHGGRRIRLFSPYFPQKHIINLLLFHNANVNSIHLANGMTALHIACLRGDDERLIKLLLENGADLQAKDYAGRTAYDMLSVGYEEAQRVITQLTVNVTDRRALERGCGIESLRFGTHGQPDNESETATLPTRFERSANQFKIKKLISHKVGVDLSW